MHPTADGVGEILGPIVATVVLVAAILWVVVASLSICAVWVVGLARRVI